MIRISLDNFSQSLIKFWRCTNIPIDIIEEDEKQPTGQIEETKHNQTDKEIKLKNQNIEFEKYRITYNPTRKDVRIQTTDENEWHLRINTEKINTNEFYMQDDRLYIADNNERTPFKIIRENGVINLQIFEDEQNTGMVISFKIE